MKSKNNTSIMFLAGILIISSAIRNSFAGSYIGPKDKEIFDHYADSLWSEDVKQIVKDQYIRLASNDINEQKKAILVLYDIRAIELLEQVIRFGNPVEASLAASLLTKLAQPGDIDQATRILPIVSKRHYAMNTEGRGVVYGQRKNMVQLVTKIIGQDFSDIDFASENGMDLVAERVDKWIKSQQPASTQPAGQKK